MENGTGVPTISSRRYSSTASAAFLWTGPLDGVPGNPESPHGADFIMHAPAPVRPGSGFGSGCDSLVCLSRGPQQQEAP